LMGSDVPSGRTDGLEGEVVPSPAERSYEGRRRLARLSTPLGLAFSGELLVVLDLRVWITIGDRTSGMDVLPDALGLVLLAAGFGLLAFGGHFEGRAELVATAVASLYVGLAAMSIAAWFFPALEHLDPRGDFVIVVAAAAGLLAVCWLLYGLCLRLGLTREARAWQAAALLFAVLWPLPVTLPLNVPALRSSPLFKVLAPQMQLVPVAAFLVAALRLRSAARRASPQSRFRGVAR
jgi:hypothetical protein